MVYTTLVVCFLCLLLVVYSAEVVKLTEENFDGQFASKDWLIKFYAPWCHHCKTLKPIFQQLAETVSHVGIAEVDATESKKIAQRFNVSSYPTIIYKQEGLVGVYDGPRTIEGLSFFLERMNAPAYLDIKELQEINDHSAFSDNVTYLLAYNALNNDNNNFVAKRDRVVETFKATAAKLKQHASFAILPATSDADVKQYGDLKLLKVEPSRASIVMKNVLEASAEELEAFVESNNYPLVSRFDNHNFKRLSGINNKIIVAVVVDYTRTAETAAIMQALEYAVSPLTLPSPQDTARFIFGHLDGVKWRAFIKQHHTMVPSVLILDQTNDLHQTFPLTIPANVGSSGGSSSGSGSGRSDELNADMASIILSIVHHTALPSANSNNNNDNVNFGVDSKWVRTEPMSIIQKIRYRFRSYYPWSLLVLLLPVAFVAMSLSAPFPKEKKIKNH